MKKTTRLPGCEDLPIKEYDAYIREEKQRYEQRLNVLCPSKQIQRAAMDLSEDADSCTKCFYFCPNEKETCRLPHTKAYMDALAINPCFEGVLLRLCKDLERKQKQGGETVNEIDALLNEYQSIIQTNCEAIKSLCEIIIENSGDMKSLPDLWLWVIKMLNDGAKDVLDNWENDFVSSKVSNKALPDDEYDYDDDEDDYGFDDLDLDFDYDDDDDDY